MLALNRLSVAIAVIGVCFVLYALDGSNVFASDPPVEDDGGSWTVNIDGVESVVEGEANIGDNLSPKKRVRRSSASKVDCTRTPGISMSAGLADGGESSGEIALDIDLETCAVTVAEVKYDTSSASGANRRSKRSHKPLRRGQVNAQLKAADGAGFVLTDTEVVLKFNRTSLDLSEYNTDCDTDSPAFLIGISWHEDDCRQSNLRLYSDYIKGRAEGDYHATFGPIMDYTGEHEHTSSAWLKGFVDGVEGNCRFNPMDVENLVVHLPFGKKLGVTLLCKYKTKTTN